MPLTFLSHQAVVLPLKVAAPRATSGTALVIGSMAPDVEYFLNGYPTSTVSHTWLGQLTFCLPVTLALFLIVTRVIAEPAAANAPDWEPLRLEDYALLREQPVSVRHWGIVAVSALIGSASHVILDELDVVIGGMPYHAMDSSVGWVVANVGFWVLLAAITLATMSHIGRNRLLHRWVAERAGNRPRVPGSRARGPRMVAAFWSGVALGAAGGTAYGMVYRLPGFLLTHWATWVHIWLCMVSGTFAGLLIASVVWHFARARRVHLTGNRS